ncbi:MAG: efflux RND transporter periplasmic adaptor subunit [Planctomycetota bacterium]
MLRATWIALFLSVTFLASCGDQEENFEFQTQTVKRQDLRISIRQKGTIEARNPFKVLNPIPGKSVILELVREGTAVEVGDLLFTLDVNDAEEKLLQQEISTSNAEQALFNAEKQLEIQKQQNESDVKKAELTVLFAELDQKQYLRGDLPREEGERSADITLAEEELKRAADTVKWSRELAEKGYISKDKLESDELAVKRGKINVTLSDKKLDVLKEYTSKKRVVELESNLEEAKREVLRVRAKVAAELAKKINEVKAKTGQHKLEVIKLERLKKQVSNNRVVAERAGIVIYGREGSRRESKPVEPGSTVREGQTIVEIPDMSQVRVDVDVHESWVEQVKLNMPVIIATDTGEVIQGGIESIASVPDSQSWYRNPDLKVYSTKVTIDNPGMRLRPGMNCAAEIIIEDLINVLVLPVQAVHSNGPQSFCYVKIDGEPVLREIQIGAHNDELVNVLGGVGEGDEVFLAVPPDSERIPLAKAAKPRKGKVHQSSKSKGSNPHGKQSKKGRPKMTPEQQKRWDSMSDADKKKMRQGRGRKPGGSGGPGRGTGRGQE